MNYLSDLAYIHDVGFSSFSVNSSKTILHFLESNQLAGCKVVELGCGSGTLANILVRNGFSLYGIDLSSDMITIAKKKVPKGIFVTGSLWDTEIPYCGAILSVGECLNYEFCGEITETQIHKLFSRVYFALQNGGMFIFDVICQSEGNQYYKNFTEGDDWFVAAECTETFNHITRKITTFTRNEKEYRRNVEIHEAAKHDYSLIMRNLCKVGFKVQVLNGYGGEGLRAGHKVWICSKA